MPRQFVVAKFRESDTRAYTYHNDGEPVAAGDVVRVTDRSGEGWKKVFVVSVNNETPPFATKPIIGRHVEDVREDAFDDADLERSNDMGAR